MPPACSDALALVHRLYPEAKPLEQLLQEIVRAAGAGDSLQARLQYVQDIPGYADLCLLTGTAAGVINRDAPGLPAGTVLEQHLTQSDVCPWLSSRTKSTSSYSLAEPWACTIDTTPWALVCNSLRQHACHIMPLQKLKPSVVCWAELTGS